MFFRLRDGGLGHVRGVQMGGLGPVIWGASVRPRGTESLG